MKIAIASTSDAVGGAAIAARRLAEALNGAGVGAKMLVKDKKTDSNFVENGSYGGLWGRAMGFKDFVSERLSFLPHERDKSVRFMFSLANFGRDISGWAAARGADVVNIHWVNQGFLSLESFRRLARLGKPLFFTLHDMWLFTGGCHYADTCEGFLRECGNCPLVKKPKAGDLSNKIWKRKKKLFESIDFQVITPSAWLAQIAQKSSLLAGKKVHVLPNPINTEVFAPMPDEARRELRQKYALPTDKKLIFFFAMNLSHERKGFPQLLEALQKWSERDPKWHERCELLVAGKADPKTLEGLPCKAHYLGFLSGNQSVMEAYNLADIFVTPSLEDNLPNTVMESLACGAPVVAFRTGGIPEMVTHGSTGYIADYRDASDLAAGLADILADDARLVQLRANARQKALDDYAYPQVAARALAIFSGQID